jgi:hypothetical protein
MNILDFNRKFPTEKSCINYLKDLRLNQGIVCDNCNTITKHWWLDKINKFQCGVCNSRTNIKSGTIMEKSKITLQVWFMCIHLMTTTKKPFSCLEMMRQLGISKYETVSMMMNKIRLSMGKRESKYKLKGDIEMDDCFIEVVDVYEKDELGNRIDTDKELITTNKSKRGRGSSGKQTVLVLVESRPREQTKSYRKNREMGYMKMIVMDDLTNDGVNYEISKHIDFDSHIISDGFRGFSKVKNVIKKHSPEVVKPKDCMKKLPWVHTVISNCKRELLGVHHSVRREYLQNYLNEFCYKLNRRNFETDLFDRMLVCGINDTWY